MIITLFNALWFLKQYLRIFLLGASCASDTVQGILQTLFYLFSALILRGRLLTKEKTEAKKVASAEHTSSPLSPDCNV